MKCSYTVYAGICRDDLGDILVGIRKLIFEYISEHRKFDILEFCIDLILVDQLISFIRSKISFNCFPGMKTFFAESLRPIRLGMSFRDEFQGFCIDVRMPCVYAIILIIQMFSKDDKPFLNYRYLKWNKLQSSNNDHVRYPSLTSSYPWIPDRRIWIITGIYRISPVNPVLEHQGTFRHSELNHHFKVENLNKPVVL